MKCAPSLWHHWLRWGAGLGVVLAAAACGTDGGAHLRVVVSAINDAAVGGAELDEDVAVGVDKSVYQVLFRIGDVAIETSAGVVTSTRAVNLDLLTRTTLVETQLEGTELHKVVLAVPRPLGDGVLRGEPVSVFAAGLFGGVPFEYRDDAMESIEVAAETRLAGDDLVVHLVFDLHRWFDEIDDDVLAAEDDGEYRLDHDEDNVEAARKIEEGIRQSVSAVVGDAPTCSTCDDDS